MSVLVRDMEMPTKCVSCDLRAFNGIMDECRATRRKMYGFEYQKGFPDWCPLVEVKTPHGRLVDGDELAAGCDSPHYCRWLSEIEDMPTVLEAEG